MACSAKISTYQGEYKLNTPVNRNCEDVIQTPFGFRAVGGCDNNPFFTRPIDTKRPDTKTSTEQGVVAGHLYTGLPTNRPTAESIDNSSELRPKYVSHQRKNNHVMRFNHIPIQRVQNPVFTNTQISTRNEYIVDGCLSTGVGEREKLKFDPNMYSLK